MKVALVLFVALAVSGTFDILTDIYIFVLWVFFGLNGAAVFVLRRTRPDAGRPYRVWGYPYVPFIFLLLTVYLLVNTMRATWNCCLNNGAEPVCTLKHSANQKEYVPRHSLKRVRPQQIECLHSDMESYKNNPFAKEDSIDKDENRGDTVEKSNSVFTFYCSSLNGLTVPGNRSGCGG